MQKHKSMKWMSISLVVLVIVVISIVAANIIIVTTTKCNSSRNATLLQNGPWSCEGIWKDSESTFYLICKKIDPDSFATVTAYILVNDNWETFTAHLRQSSNVISFEDPEGNVLVTAKAELNNQTLILSNFMFKNEFSGIERKELLLYKCVE